ncbi:MAG: hypothetical protein ACOY0T_40990 [Myxococcota bacterium]
MSKGRLLFLNSVLALLIGIHVFENVIDDEHWPFCSYPMYSELETERAITSFKLVGVQHDGRETVVHKNEFIHPFDQSRMSEGLQNAHFDQGEGVVALNDVLQRYERRRREREHTGPALVRLRLYRMKHQLEPWAENFDRPEERELLVESAVLE